MLLVQKDENLIDARSIGSESAGQVVEECPHMCLVLFAAGPASVFLFLLFFFSLDISLLGPFFPAGLGPGSQVQLQESGAQGVEAFGI